MKTIIVFAIASLIGFGANAQIESAVYATGAVGINRQGQTLISAGLHANMDRVYAGFNATPDISGAVIYEARAGLIMGNSICAVPYVGYAVQVQPKQFDEYGAKFSASSPSSGLAYGMLLTAPTAWDKTRLLVSIQMFDGKPSVAAGFKLQLTKSSCDR